MNTQACIAQALGADLIVWPESALPDLRQCVCELHRQRLVRADRAGSGCGDGRDAPG